MIRLKMPPWLTVILSVALAVLEYFNEASFHWPPVWHYLLVFGLAILAYLGIAPATHSALQTVLKLSHAAMVLITTLVSLIDGVILTLSISQNLKGLLIGVITLIGGLLVGTAGGPGPVVAQAQPAPPGTPTP